VREGVVIYVGDYIHESARIGRGTKIAAGHDIGRDVEIGENCLIECHVSISNGWKIGNNVFIGPGVHFANDPYPPSKVLLPGVVEDNCVICMGANVGPGVTIGEGAVVGMGANIRHHVESESVVVGDGYEIYKRDEFEWRKLEYESSGTV